MVNWPKRSKYYIISQPGSPSFEYYHILFLKAVFFQKYYVVFWQRYMCIDGLVNLSRRQSFFFNVTFLFVVYFITICLPNSLRAFRRSDVNKMVYYINIFLINIDFHYLMSYSGFSFISSFFKTVHREWHGIDRLRLDKFYMVSVEKVILTSMWNGCLIDKRFLNNWRILLYCLIQALFFSMPFHSVQTLFSLYDYWYEKFL